MLNLEDIEILKLLINLNELKFNYQDMKIYFSSYIIIK